MVIRRMPKGLNAEERFQLSIYALLRDVADVEKQITSGRGITKFVNSNPKKVREVSSALAQAHKYIQKQRVCFLKGVRKKNRLVLS